MQNTRLWQLIAFTIVAELILWGLAAGAIKDKADEEAFLLRHDTADGYLVPVDCGGSSKGVKQEDYITGTVAARENGRKVKTACLYSRQSFDRLFPELVLGDQEAAHQKQADRVGTTLQRPSRQAAVNGTRFVSFGFAGLAVVMGVLLWRRGERFSLPFGKKGAT